MRASLSLSLIMGWEMWTAPVYLWSLPMFHCNGWTFTWGTAARGGTDICICSPITNDIYRSIAEHDVTHMCCAPVIFNILLEAKPSERRPLKSMVEVLTGGAPPIAALLLKMESLGFHVTHAYGVTEATGAALSCEWQAQWNDLEPENRAKLKERQGVSILSLADVHEKNPETMNSIGRDGKTMGEIFLLGSSVMKGYYKDPELTSKAFKDGWFLTGDVEVIHPDGYVKIKDMSKDVIISGDENIRSVELESVSYAHPSWGESPCVFLVLKDTPAMKTGSVDEAENISYCQKKLPGFMVLKKVVFIAELPKTSTGKVLKSLLQKIARELVVSADTGRRRVSRKVGTMDDRILQS